MSLVYKILDRAEWERAVTAGRFAGSSVDLQDGFIHLSSAAQAQDTARLHFRGRPGLVLAAFPAEALGPALKWEPSLGGALFPHLHGALDPALAVDVRGLELDLDGVPLIPDREAEA